MVSETRARCTKVAETYARVEDDSNELLRVVRKPFPRNGHCDFGLDLWQERPGSQRGPLPAGDPGHGGLFAGQGYARRRFRGGRDREVGGVMNEE